MLKLRKPTERGTTQLDWLDSQHTFSFGDYYDPEHRGFSVLRVINEDKVAPIAGFDTHPHRDMEIITYVLEGTLEHQDTLGTSSIIKPGDVQRMSAGTGIMHSEYNPLNNTHVHLLQIWIIPDRKGLPPSYEQKNFTKKRKPGNLTLLASHDGKDDSLTIHQDAFFFVLDLDSGQSFAYAAIERRKVWVQIARGSTLLNGKSLVQGDGAALTDEKTLKFEAKEKTEVLIFDLPH